MATKAQKVRLAIFLLAAGGILIFLIALIAGMRLLEESFHYYIEFEETNVSGLSRGASVNYLGLTIGQVDEISIPAEAVNTIVVAIAVKEQYSNVIRTDTEASLSTHPLSGQKHVELINTLPDASPLPPDSRIRSNPNSLFADIEQRGAAILDRLDEFMANATLITKQENRIQIARLLDQGAKLAENANLLIAENRHDTRRTMQNMAAISASMAATTASLSAVSDTLGRLIASPTFGRTVENLHIATGLVRRHLEGPLPDLLSRTEAMVGTIDTTFIHIDRTVLQSRTDFLSALQDMQEALQNIREATELIREDPSILIRGRGGE
jgi:phospholipid/cholesterol/gamma-HCH transport system substrate-binding protein